jgi:copper resistance protein C
MVLRRMSAAVMLAGLALVATAPPALAHTTLKSSTPAEGASLDAAPQQVELRFGEAVALPDNPIQVTGPDGAKWTVGKAALAGAVVTAPVEPSGPAGAYELTYTVISDDGDEVKGTVNFTLTKAAGSSTTPPLSSSAAPATTIPPSPAAQASDSGGGGLPAGVWVLIALAVVLAVGIAVASRLRSSRQRGD